MSLTTQKKDACVFCPDAELVSLIPSGGIPGNVTVFKCTSCGLVFLENRSGDAAALDPEEKAYWDNAEQKQIYLQEKIQDVFMKEFEARLVKMKKHLGRTGKLLDVGCGVGHFLERARAREWQVRGLDIAQAASDAAREAYQLDVALGTLEDVPLPPGSFDAVTLWDVIEHIRRPVENVKAINQLLAKGGIVVMKTPDEESLYKLVARAFYRTFGSKFLLKYVYYIPHYFSYSPKTMRILFEKCGFEVLEFEHDETPIEFATEKIHAHYKKDPKRSFVISMLPIVQKLARLLNRSNKMIVYARKVREI